MFAFQILYISITIADSLHPISTNVLIAESHHKERWGSAFARYNFVVGIGSAVGLAACGLFIANIGYRTVLLICSPIVFSSFIMALFMLEEPPIYVQLQSRPRHLRFLLGGQFAYEHSLPCTVGPSLQFPQEKSNIYKEDTHSEFYLGWKHRSNTRRRAHQIYSNNDGFRWIIRSHNSVPNYPCFSESTHKTSHPLDPLAFLYAVKRVYSSKYLNSFHRSPSDFPTTPLRSFVR